VGAVAAARRMGKVGSALLPAVWSARDPSVLVVTALHSQPCAYPRGDHLNFLSVMNKQARPGWELPFLLRSPASSCPHEISAKDRASKP